MALSLALIILLCLVSEWLFTRLGLPPLVGMIGIGVLFGPSILNLIHPSLLNVSSDLRLMALIIILLRSGFKLSKGSLTRWVAMRCFWGSFRHL